MSINQLKRRLFSFHVEKSLGRPDVDWDEFSTQLIDLWLMQLLTDRKRFTEMIVLWSVF
jgi:hypothetical protein